MNDCETDSPVKTCSKCGQEFPATAEFFHTQHGRWQPQCKQCSAAYNKRYREANREVISERRKARYQENPEPARERARRSRLANPERAAERTRGWYEKNKELCNGRSNQWYQANRESVLALLAAKYKTNPDPVRTRSTAWYRAHPKEAAERARAYRAAHPEECSARARAHREAYPEEYAAHNRNRKARKKGNGGSHTAADIQAQYERQRGRCFWCPKKLGKKYHVDHVVPIILGGSNGPENLVLACPECNLSKGAKHPMDWCGMLF